MCEWESEQTQDDKLSMLDVGIMPRIPAPGRTRQGDSYDFKDDDFILQMKKSRD